MMTKVRFYQPYCETDGAKDILNTTSIIGLDIHEKIDSISTVPKFEKLNSDLDGMLEKPEFIL